MWDVRFCCNMRGVVSNSKQPEFLQPQSWGDVPGRASTPLKQQMPTCLDNPVGLSEFIIEIA